MIVNIARTTIDYEALIDNLADFDGRSDNVPYAIMNEQTMDGLPLVLKTDNGGYEFRGYRLLINNDLRYGDVDIR